MKFLRFFGSEIILGTLIAVLSVMTAMSSYQGAMSDSEQNKSEIEGMSMLTDANAEYLTANQQIIQDYTYFDNWYLNQEERPDLAEYFKTSFSEALNAGIERDPDVVFDDQYYEQMYLDPQKMFDDSDVLFDKASEWDERGDQLQLVMLIMALGLAFAAWASLLKEESNMRLLFAILSVITAVMGIITYLGVPVVSG